MQLFFKLKYLLSDKKKHLFMWWKYLLNNNKLFVSKNAESKVIGFCQENYDQ